MVIFMVMVIMGCISLVRLPVELYQGQSQNIVSIVIHARGGLSPVEVEKRITKPVEEAVATVSRLKGLYSSSREAESRVTMEFELGTNMNFAALEVREKFSRVKPILPQEIEKPVIANYDDSEAAVFVFALTSQAMSPEDIGEVANNELKPILGRVDGVASVEVYGARERKILVELDRDKMVAYNISVERVMDIIGQSNVNLLAGKVDTHTLALAIRSMGAFTSVEEIGELGIKGTRQGSIIPLKEIATIKDAYMEPEDESRLNLEQNITVYVKKTSQANTIPVARRVRAVLHDFEHEYKDRMNVVMVTDKAKVISKAIDEVKETLYVGMVLTIVLIYGFLRQWRLSLIVLISLPISVIATFMMMDFFGISINVMTLSGLSLAHGVLVDSSIVILENILVKKERGATDFRAIREGAEEVWLALLASLTTMIVVFIPILFIDKKIQMMYAGLSFTIVASLIISFFVAQMLVPMLMMQWTRGHLKVSGDHHTQRGLMGVFENGYHRLMELNLRHRYLVVFLVFLLFTYCGPRLMSRHIDTPSTYEENEFAIIIFPLAGARLEANSDAVKKVEELLAKIPDIKLFSTTVRQDDVRVSAQLKPKAEREYSKDEILDLIDKQGNEMVKEVHDDYSLLVDEGASSSDQKKLVVNIFGNEGDVLQKLAIEFSNRMGKVKGLSNIVMTDLRKRPEYSLVVDRGRAALYGLTTAKIADSVHAQVRGMRPTKYHELTKGQEIEVITRLQAIYRQKIDDLKLVPIETNNGKQVPLGEVANFYPSVGPQTIDRMDKYRYVFVKGDVKVPLEQAANDVKAALAGVELPDEYYWRFGGGFEELVGSKSQLSMALLLTLFLVYGTMACLFQSYLQPLLIMLAVPLAAVGIWAGLELTHKPLSHQVFIGMIILTGYVVNAAIIMVDRCNLLLASGMPKREAVVRSCLDRFRPIVMTTCSTVLGFMPMAFNWGQASDLWSPLAVTVIGGMTSSTILTLFVLPDFMIICDEIVAACRKIADVLSRFFSNLLRLGTVNR